MPTSLLPLFDVKPLKQDQHEALARGPFGSRSVPLLAGASCWYSDKHEAAQAWFTGNRLRIKFWPTRELFSVLGCGVLLARLLFTKVDMAFHAADRQRDVAKRGTTEVFLFRSFGDQIT